MSFSRYTKLVAIVFLIALSLRLAPVLIYGMPISYDTPFHVRAAEFALQEQSIPLYEFSIEKRPNNYPPFYHLLLIELSLVSGISILDLSMFLLPFFSSLLCVSIFILARKIFDGKKALLVSLLFALMPLLVTNSYDSPENFVFFILPLLLLLLYKEKKAMAAFLYSTSIFWNYFVFLVTFPALVFSYRKDRKFLSYLFSSVALVIIFNFLVRGLSFIDNKSLEAGMQFISFNLRDYLLPLVLLTSLLAVVFAVIAYSKRFSIKNQKQNQVFDFFFAWNALAVIGMLSFFLTDLFRPWEHMKFAAFSVLFLLPLLYSARRLKYFSAFAVILLVISLPISCQILFPKITQTDSHAINFLENNSGQGNIIAEPSFSEYIRIKAPSLSDRLVSSLYYENLAKESIMHNTLLFLMLDSSLDEQAYLLQSGASHLILNYEDFAVRNAELFYEKPYLDKVYSLNYYNNCPFPFISRQTAYACYENKTEIFRVNSFLKQD